MKKPLLLLFLICNVVNPGKAQELSETKLWGNLVPGKFSVGYMVKYEYDYSRTIKSKYNYRNELISENNFRPVQISVWYPANTDSNDSPMAYSEYILSRASQFDYTIMTPEGKEQILLRYCESMNWYNQSDAKNEDITNYLINRKTRAYKDAIPLEGNFPLILFCSGGGDAPDSFDILFEFLASHGYVIAAIPSNGMYNNKPSYNMMDEESQIRDMEFTLNLMRDFPNADITNICSMGYSYGGLVNVLFALRNFDIRTVLSLDGSICLKDRDRSVKILPYYNPSWLHIPFMNMARKAHNEQDFSFFNDMKYSDAYLLHFNQMEHADFKSKPSIRDFEDIKSSKNRNVISISKGNELVYIYSLHFLNAYMMDDSTSLAFIQHTPEQNSISQDILEIEYRKALEIPPMGKDFIDFVKDEGINKGQEEYHRAKNKDPEIIMFNKDEINSLGYFFLNRGKTEDAIKVFQLFVLEYPETSNSYDSLGEAYAKNNNIKDALYNYRKALKLNPYSQSAARAIKRLERLQEKAKDSSRE